MIRFFYNGLKSDNCKKLQKAFYSEYKNGIICVHAKDYESFSKEIHDQFAVINKTDIMTDYFEKDRFQISPTHPLYNAAKKAMLQNSLKLFTRRYKKCKDKGWDAQADEWMLKINEYEEQIKSLEVV